MIAKYWFGFGDNFIKCTLCARNCILHSGEYGYCGVRKNIDGILHSMNYGKLCGGNVEKLDKQPISFYPTLGGDSKTLVIGSPGCNLGCKFCINAAQSQGPRETGKIEGINIFRDDLIDAAISCGGCTSVTYAYTEPTIYYEYMYDMAKYVHENTNLKNILITNGYMNTIPLKNLVPYVDAVNVDLKGTQKFYQVICDASIHPVLKNIMAWDECNVHIEVTTLIIPEYNSEYNQLRELAGYISCINDNIPWHLTKFYPAYKMMDVSVTTNEQLNIGLQAGKDAGLKRIKVWY